MPGLLDLSTELRLAIFKDIFDQEDECALTHPLLHMCRTTRLEYIDAISGTFFLSILGTPGLATHPDLDLELYPWFTPKFTIIRLEDNIRLHSKNKRLDLFALADSPCAWLIEHACGAFIRPVDIGSDRASPWPSENYSKPFPNYRLSFEKGVAIQPLLDYDLGRKFSSKKDEILEIARKELSYWESGQMVEEDSRPLNTTKNPSHGRRTRWILAFMRHFDADNLEFPMTGELRDYTMSDRWEHLHAILQ